MQNNIQIKLYDQLYKDAQKVIRRDPDLMAMMQISIEDNEITSGNKE